VALDDELIASFNCADQLERKQRPSALTWQAASIMVPDMLLVLVPQQSIRPSVDGRQTCSSSCAIYCQ
jgi:hypothetical protein